jgi:CHAT domain-containing protein
MHACRCLLVVSFITSCTPPPVPREAAPRGEPLEAELARIDPSSAPGATVARSRVLRALGRQPEATAQLDVAIDAARERLDWRGLGDLWRELGDLQIEIGRPQDALDTYGKRLSNARSLDATRDRAVAQVDMAYAFAFLSQWTPAQHALEDAEVLARGDLEADAASLEKMAYVREKLLAREVAIALFAKARVAYARAGDANGEARAAIARAYLDALEHETAAPLATLDELAGRARDPEPRARLLRYRGEAAYLFGRDHGRCLALAEQAMPIAEQRGNHALAQATSVLVSVCAGKLGKVEQAVAAAERAVGYAEDEWASTSVPSARQAIGFEALLLYRHILSLDVKLTGPRRTEAAFEAMEKARGRAHIDAAVRGGAGLLSTSVEVPPLLARSKREIEAHVAELDKQIVTGRNDPAQLERRRDALWALDDVKAAIAYHNPLVTRMRVPQPATLARARELLDDRTMLLAYLMTSDEAVAIAVTRSDARLFVIEGGPAELATDIAQFRDEALVQPDATMDAVRTGAGALGEKLLAPVADLVAAHDRLIILPHGPLAMLPFEALLDGKGRFVIESHEVSYAQSATLALEDAHRRPAAPGRRAFVGLGDPVYDWASFRAGRPEGSPADARGLRHYLDARRTVARRTAARAGLERLPGTAREVTAIAQLFGAGARLYLRDQASEENVKAGILASTRLIHIASHGLFETDYQALALTMRPDGTEDGFLLQSEIAELKLDADLVVLSACETGRAHEVLAEPVSGLALALRTAGARSMIASLWSVDDDATVELMTAFYTALVKDQKPFGRALTEAKRRLVGTRKWRHPYYWAPFVLVGSS